MTLDQLKILEQIVERGSIGAAAKALFRTQPTLSVAMKKMEEEFGVLLFSREHHKATLTPIGRAMYQKAKTVLKQAESFENLGKQLAMGEEPELKIAFANVPLQPILDVLKKCGNCFPHTQLTLLSENLTGAEERLLENEADLAVFAAFIQNDRFESFPFTKFRLYSVASPDFLPAPNHQDVIPQDEMKERIQIILKDTSRRPVAQTYGVIEGGRNWKVNDLQTKKEIILNGMGWGSLPTYLIEDELKSGQLVRLNIENYRSNYEPIVHVSRMYDKPVGPAAQQLWDDFKEYAAHHCDQHLNSIDS